MYNDFLQYMLYNVMLYYSNVLHLLVHLIWAFAFFAICIVIYLLYSYKQSFYFKGESKNFANNQFSAHFVLYVSSLRILRSIFKRILRNAFKKNAKSNQWSENQVRVIENIVPRHELQSLEITYINHATFLIQGNNINILTDPVYSKSIGPRIFNWPLFNIFRMHKPGIKFEDLPKIHMVLISHNHFDHMDQETIVKLHKIHKPLFITPLGNDTILKRMNKTINTVSLDYADSHKYNDDITITLERAYHWSKRSAYDTNKALWGSFVIEFKKEKVFFAGDTSLHTGEIFKDIKNKYQYFDVSLIPIGAYQPEYSNMHCSPAEGLQIHNLLNSKHSIAMHWGCFKLSTETQLEPIEKISNDTFTSQGFIYLLPGETYTSKIKL